MLVKKEKLSILSLLIIVLTAEAQVITPGTYIDSQFYAERLESDSVKDLTYHSSIKYADQNYFSILSPYTQFSFNTKYPRGYNDGAIWKGKGITQEFQGGFQWKQGFLRMTFSPIVYYSQNLSYNLAKANPAQHPYNYQFGVSKYVDFVQRYGDEGAWNFNLGQSEIAFQTKVFRISASTQNFTLGPGRYNSIIMSNSGAGFPHIMLSTPNKLELNAGNVKLGAVEANIFYGLLKESSYFDTLSSNDKRYLNGLSIGYEIPYVKGLTVGFHRSMYKNTTYFETADIYSMFFIKDDGIVISPSGDTTDYANDTFDQLASASIDWKIEEAKLRLYFEFARNDFNGSMRRFITEFEHSRAYLIGFEKIFDLKEKKKLHLGYEHTFLPRYQSYRYRPTPPFYTHHVAIQGYTNNGQLLGSGIGPGSVSDIVRWQLYSVKNILGMSFQRIRFDEDYFITVLPDVLEKIEMHDVEFTLGANYINTSNPRFHWGIQTNLSYRFNMYFLKENDQINFAGNVFASYNLFRNLNKSARSL